MPRKTKKEKVRAAQRRKRKQKTNKNISQNLKISSAKKNDKLISYTYQPTGTSSHKTSINQASSRNYSWVYSDLLRMFVFTLLAIASQIVLYFILRG